ncbi:Mu transposase C-terminal domain-containing protein [Vibrio rumoiensis]|uniref:Mu transposase C-terminal domain-containing protein n=1 Tax=Vibrio rumoiensis TaxID=76258 RepID=A0ABW7IUY2_9VIBR
MFMDFNDPDSFFDEFKLDETSEDRDVVEKSLEVVQFDPKLSIDSYPLSIQNEIQKRLAYIRFVNARINGGWTQRNLTPILREASQSLPLPAPKWRALVNWKKAYYESGESIHALIPRHKGKGNREKKNDSEKYVLKAINEKYLIKERVRISETYAYYRSLVMVANKSIVSGGIQVLSKRTFYNRVQALPPYEVDLARYGKRYADKKYRSTGQQIPATMPMEYVEIDHTPVPVILIDDELKVPLGRPYLTILYDRYSKCIVGFSINFKEPSYDSVRKAILNAVLEKDWVKEKYPAITNPWLCHGKIQNLVVDNGAEFWSESLEDALRPLVSNIIYAQAGKPWRKSGVEKIFDQLNKGLVDKIPGKTFARIEQLKDYNPKLDAVVSVSTFLELMHKWIIDIYHQSPDARERAIPALMWKESLFRPVAYKGHEKEQLKVELGPVHHRTIGLGGIRLYNMRYESKELIEYRKKNALDNSGKLYVKTKTDPMDLSYIYVYLENESRYIKVPVVDNTNYTHGLTLFQHKIVEKVRRLNTRFSADELSLAESRLYIEERIQSEINRSSNKKRPNVKVGSTSKLAKYHEVGSDGPTTIVASQSNSEPSKNTDHSLIEEVDWDDESEDIEGY